MMKRFYTIVFLLLLPFSLLHAEWASYFAYNEVSRIAVSDRCVYAISNGALFSVDVLTEKIQKYDTQSGLHATGLTCMYYDHENEQLLLIYSNGKIDVMDEHGVQYISGLYDKDVTYDKRVNNITVYDGIAYLSTSYGIQTFDLAKRVLVDSYFIGPLAKNMEIYDVVFQGDSIYAFANDCVMKASMKDNIVDYRVWQSELLPGSVSRDSNKGVRELDTIGNLWLAGGAEGLVCEQVIGTRLVYKPDGPAINIPYHMYYDGGRLYVVPGARWASQEDRPGWVMIYDGEGWKNISSSQVNAVTKNPALDFMSVAVDPQDEKHYFVCSYGTGLYEFRDDNVVCQYLPSNSTLSDASGANPTRYTRCDGAIYDVEGNLLIPNAGPAQYTLAVYTKDGEWKGAAYQLDGKLFSMATPVNLMIDSRNPAIKYIPLARVGTGLFAVNDANTLYDSSDDVSVHHTEWEDQDNQLIKPDFIYSAMITSDNSIWLGTNIGPVIIPSDVDVLQSNKCRRLRIQEGDAYLMEAEVINAIAEDNTNRIWVGTARMGVYVLSADGEEVLEHYTTANSSMPSNSVMSLAWDNDHQIMYIGTGDGLVAVGENISSGLWNYVMTDDESEPNFGSMEQWHLHRSFAKLDKIYMAHNRIYVLSSGSVFYVDKKSDNIYCLDKLSGLSGGTISRAAYDDATDQLILIYPNGMIDIVSEEGVTCMVDLFIKSSGTDVTVQDVVTDNGKAYLAMTFGVMCMDLRKHVITDTYYIGPEASNVDVMRIGVTSDSIFAFARDKMYLASRHDFLMDYHNWTSYPITSVPTHLVTVNNRLYGLFSKQLNCWQNKQWQPKLSGQKLNWMTISNWAWLCDVVGKGPARISSDVKLTQLPISSSLDLAFDAASSSYWQITAKNELIRVSDGQLFRPDGPLTNDVATLTFAGDRLFVCPGGRWAAQEGKDATLSVYENGQWKSWTTAYMKEKLGGAQIKDVVSVAADENNPTNFYVATYGTGLIEFENDEPKVRYTVGVKGSTLLSAIPMTDKSWDSYVRVEGLCRDEYGNIWMQNAGEFASTINIITPEKKWYSYNLSYKNNHIPWVTPSRIFIDNRDSRFKWMIDQRKPLLVLHNDNGTPLDGRDDAVCARYLFTDQDGIQLSPSFIYCAEQDRNGDVWVGTPAGVLVIQSGTDFMKSDACYRIKLGRADGTGLADYLLGTEAIRCILVDGGNRKWIGTEASGLFLVSEDGQKTIHHFTSENSPLPSDKVLSLAINPKTGELFIGTGAGVASFQTDASMPAEDYSEVYAYPNPVRPNYQGVITITGLMEDSFVTIIDAGGNLICKTRSFGGTAIWDGNMANGQRATSGVYTVLCNEKNGKAHAVTKILIIR